MEGKSLEQTLDAIIKSIDKLDIPITDKVELMTNLKHFLDPEAYRSNIELLAKEQNQRRKRYEIK